MTKKLFYEHPYRVFGWVLAVLLLLLVLMEGWRYAVKPSTQGKQQALAQTLDDVADRFSSEQNALQQQTQELANTLQRQLNQQQSRGDLFKSIQDFPQFWGVGLYQDQQPLVWNKFSLETFQDIHLLNDLDSYVEVKKQSNVLLWVAHTGFTIASEDREIPYHLYTARRIEQSNVLPIGDDREYSMLENIPSNDLYSIRISIYDPLPSTYTNYRVLHSASNDSLGVVYATMNSLEKVKSQWKTSNRFWRAVFVLLCFIVVGLLIYIRLDSLAPLKALCLQLIIVGIGWIVFNQINIAENWLPALLDTVRPDHMSSYQMLCNFSVDGLFFLITAFTLRRNIFQLQFQISSTSFFGSIFASIGGGIVNVLAIVFTFKVCYKLALTTTIPLLSLRIYPGIGTLLFYLVIGLMLWALTMTLLVLNQFLLRCCEDQYKLVTTICSATFIAGLVIIQLFIGEFYILSWSFNIAAIYFGIVFALSYWYFRYPYSVPHSSPLRTAAIYSLLIAIAASTITYHAKIRTIDSVLAQNIENFTQQDDPRAEQLTSEILTTLEQSFKSLTEEDLQERSSFIQAQFTQSIIPLIQNKASLYSYDLQLTDPNLNTIADYSTNLNSPQWVSAFNLSRLKAGIEIEQISKNNVRPIVQQPELVDEENYQTFYRGWIPIFGIESNNPIAWILCSVYQERPDFNKPMRAVLASLNYRDWENSSIIQEYTNNRLTETVSQGVREHFPLYNKLRTGERDALQQDSTVYYTSVENDQTYRNLLTQQTESTVIKSTTLLPGYQHILFAFFRLSFTLLVAGFLILVIHQWIATGKVTLFSDDQRFQYRILDSFLLATLLFLIILIFVTHFAIQRQNTDLVKTELFEKLRTMTTTTEKSPVMQRQLNRQDNVSLDSLTAPLNVDASFYNNQSIAKSTAPQIYEQHLLPAALPYPVYSDLFLSQKRDALTEVMLGGQPLLVGYRSVLSNDGEDPIAAIAIPTFVQSPKYNKQLLETTSYLIILYLVVFGLFIVGTFFISRQLTRPLVHIQRGLNKISRGDLETTIPATSNDEIGGLATAYNQMVSRLKELQGELAAAEREAAWQEMAQQVAHEIKNPLTPMKLNIQHLERQLASGDYTISELKEKIRTITQNLIVQIQTLNNIASDFSKFSKPIEQEFATVNMNDLVQSVADLYKHDEQRIIHTNCRALPASVFGAEDELRRVIINLVKNAHEAMPNGGTIAIQTSRKKDHLFIEVEDNGEGISEEDKPKIFVPNFSTKSSGTGLGLAICKKIIQAHEGSISFASIKSEGTTFVIKLPIEH